jgi:hypothetical protein
MNRQSICLLVAVLFLLPFWLLGIALLAQRLGPVLRLWLESLYLDAH